jgi:uncharacterized protein (DUF4415 family)
MHSLAALRQPAAYQGSDIMNTEFDLSTTTPRAVRPVKRKTRITIYLDDEVLSQFRSLSEQSGKGYQTLINAALRTRLASTRTEPLPAA